VIDPDWKWEPGLLPGLPLLWVIFALDNDQPGARIVVLVAVMVAGFVLQAASLFLFTRFPVWVPRWAVMAALAMAVWWAGATDVLGVDPVGRARTMAGWDGWNTAMMLMFGVSYATVDFGWREARRLAAPAS
jgi:hypothetical protein